MCLEPLVKALSTYPCKIARTSLSLMLAMFCPALLAYELEFCEVISDEADVIRVEGHSTEGLYFNLTVSHDTYCTVAYLAQVVYLSP